MSAYLADLGLPSPHSVVLCSLVSASGIRPRKKASETDRFYLLQAVAAQHLVSCPLAAAPEALPSLVLTFRSL